MSNRSAIFRYIRNIYAIRNANAFHRKLRRKQRSKNQNSKMINRKFIATQLHTAAFSLIALRIVQFSWKIVCLKKKPDLFSPRPNVAYE